MKNQVQLITYVDRLSGGGLQELKALLHGEQSPLAGLFGGVHLLPFFDPIDGADAGFDPIDHTRVDPRLGSWQDIRALAEQTDVMGDVIVNHVSSKSPQFLDWSAKGARSDYEGMFLTLGAVFPNGASEAELLRVYRPRPGLPLTYTTLASGDKKILWTTFTPQQVDINVEHPQGAAYLSGILDRFAASGISMIRLDAVGYAIKRAGTSCFMLPETFGFVDDFTRQAHARGIEVLVEVHSHYQFQVDLAKRVDWVYDFALPPLVLHALIFQDSVPLQRWMAIRPSNSLTVLDTHDGIGIIDVGADASDRAARPGLLVPEQLDRLVEAIHVNSQHQSREATGAAASNLDLYQVNCSFYAALGRDDRAYLIARAIQFFLPGVPQVYYVGLLAGDNDMALLRNTRVGRDINRHYYEPGEVEATARRPVVQDLMTLIRLRNRHPAFGGNFEWLASSPSELSLVWRKAEDWVTLDVNLASRTLQLSGSLDAERVRLSCFESSQEHSVSVV